MASNRLDAILAPDYVEELSSLPIEEIRRRRSECDEIETSLSYSRRLVQGRLDIVAAELRHRRDGVASDLHSLIEELPSILSEKVHAGGNGRLSNLLAPGSQPELDEVLAARVDAVADDRRLSNLPNASDEEIESLLQELGTLEGEISGQRKALHERMDLLQKELMRRYKSGEADVNSLLS